MSKEVGVSDSVKQTDSPCTHIHTHTHTEREIGLIIIHRQDHENS